MPKIFEYLGISILFYSNAHEPVHVHAKYQGFESKADFTIVDGKVIDIRVVEVKGRRPLPPKQLKDFEGFVKVFGDEIVKRWVDYFVLHKQVNCVRIEGRVK